eukprot:Phypoly_transcript_01095.p1 GENE.Phypoly_transcript_01095~~Phypoly_transcript_01095.p1  ORF type:complete len:1190 (+),score=164.67 Phypoly_transcript_01095:101-3670(+)
MQYSHQGVLEKVAHELFAGRDIITNTQKSLRNPISGKAFEIDVWIPSLSLGFEFQDVYHFTTAWYYHRPLTTIQDRDTLKKGVILERGNTLVQVPYWWNSALESLVATIQFSRPDLTFETTGFPPIPLTPPNLLTTFTVPDVGELMLASVVHSVAALDERFKPSSWWMGEKYDGVRCIWNKISRSLYTRRGQKIELPQSHYTHCLHLGVFADCELWYGRGSFLETQKLICAEWSYLDWAFARLVIFDNPLPSASLMIFEDRYSSILQPTADDLGLFIVSPRVICESKFHVSKALQHILQDGGEGVILRKTNSLLEHGRSGALIKIKTMRGDCETLVISLSADSCRLKLPSGEKFTVATAGTNLAVGDVVTLEFDNYSQKNIPVNASISRVRKDLSWDDVLLDFAKEHKQSKSGNKNTPTARKVKPAKYWTSEKGKKIRAFFEDFARSLNLDPLLPDTWYSIPRKAILQEKEARSFLVGFDGNHVKALMTIFPDLDLNPSNFSTLPSKFWNSLKNRREFFDKFAALENFDPLVAENWYSVKREAIYSQKGYLALVLHYHRDYISALLHVYPDVGLVRDKFASWNYWREAANRRNFFNKIAESRSFDPLAPENWYPFTQRQISELEDGPAVLHYHRNNFITALTQLYPKIGLNKNLFHEVYWGEEKNRRNFFDQIAKEAEFDPLVAENWYWLPRAKIMEFKDGATVLSYHKNDYTLALRQLYPQIGIIRAKFRRVSFYRVKRNRRKFFDNVATKLGFDPLNAANWYTISRQSIYAFKDGTTVLGFYKNNLSHALKKIYPNMQFEKTKSQVRDVYHDHQTRKDFFVEFAQENQFDPLAPENWYPRTKRDIFAFKAGRLVMRYYKSLPSALAEVFPHLNWDESKFKVLAIDGKSPSVRRSFFDKAASDFGFDPRIPENWFSISFDDLIPLKGASRVLQFYSNKLGNALVDIYREVKNHSRFIEKHELFQKFHPRFVSLAEENGFDHEDPNNWYSVDTTSILRTIKGVKTLVDFFDGDFGKVLEFIFPHIGFDREKFIQTQQHSEILTPRKLFDEFAEKNSFDPLLADNWYKITRSKILSMKGSETILSMYGSSLSQALAQVYPEVDIDAAKFKFIEKQYWKDVDNQRAFFIDLAKAKGFDPLLAKNWYSCSYWDIQGQKKAASVLAYYHGNYKKALAQAFPDLELEETKFLQV